MNFNGFRFKAAIALAGVFGVAGAAMATDYAAVEERIAGLVGDMNQVAISDSAIPGVVQVRIGGDIVYLSQDGRYLIQGNIVDMDTRINLTDAARSDVRREQLASLDASDLVTFGNSDAEFEVLVFTDPDCGFCRRMHESVEEYAREGITIHYVAYPRAGVGSSTYDKLVSVWCADDQQAAMDIAKLGQTPPRAQCDNPVADQYRLGQALGVTGTPSILTFNGDIIPGYVPPAQLRERLEAFARANGN